MSETISMSGKCLCGQVGISADAIKHNLGACHCHMCRKWGGGPLLAVESTGEVVIEGEEHITRYDSSEWAERAFCKHCGTHLFYRLKQNNMHAMPVGFFYNDDRLVFDHQIFIDEKPEYYAFVNDTKDLTGQEVFEMFSDM